MVVTRRDFVAALATAATPAASAVALDFKSGKVIESFGPGVNRRVHPGSTVKPLTAVALIEANCYDARSCSGTLRVGERRLSCSHPAVAGRIDLPVAIAYSCNEFFAANAIRVPAANLAANLRQFGLEAQTPTTPEQRALMAIGEWGVLATLTELARAYRLLRDTRVVEGMRAAAEYGTARLAGDDVAGKTGTSPAPGRLGTYALFAGWSPADAPKIVVAVLTTGRGGADAAPVARGLFEKHL